MNGLILLVAMSATAGIAAAGDLNPPPGPVAPSMKTLDEVEPRIAINQENTPGDADSLFRIASAGSYYLAGNATYGVDERCIEITSNNVTIDLNGFQIFGFSNANLEAIGTDDAFGQDVVIRNGSIRSCEGGGIVVPFSGMLVENIVVTDAADGDGINIGNGIVRGCRVQNVGGLGVRLSTGRIESCLVGGAQGDSFFVACCGTVVDCAATGGQGVGFVGESDVVFERCVATGTAGGFSCPGGGGVFRGCNANFCNGIGLNVGVSCVVEYCSVRGSSLNGMVIGEHGTVRNCTVQGSPSTGIFTSGNTSVTGCTSDDNSVGILTGFNCSVLACSTSGNTSGGIRLGVSSRAEACVVTLNGNSGILVSDEGTVDRCQISRNDGEGVDLGIGATIRDSTITGHTNDAGIEMSNDSAAIGNRVTGNDIGIRVTGDRVLVDSNTVSASVSSSIRLESTTSRCSVIANRIQASFGWILDLGAANDAPLQPNPANASAGDNLQL